MYTCCKLACYKLAQYWVIEMGKTKRKIFAIQAVALVLFTILVPCISASIVVEENEKLAVDDIQDSDPREPIPKLWLLEVLKILIGTLRTLCDFGYWWPF